MTDPNPDSRSAPEKPPCPHARRRKAVFIVAAVLAAGLIGAYVTTSFSQGFGPGFGHGFGPGFAQGFGPGGWGGGPFGGSFDPARVEDRADRMIRHLGVEIDATAEQQDKLRTIVKGALKDLLPMRDKMLATRQQARDLLVAPTVDRAAIETLRADRIAAADTASKRLAQALGDAATVLTADQRKKLNDLLPPTGGWAGRGMGWHGMGGYWRGGPRD